VALGTIAVELLTLSTDAKPIAAPAMRIEPPRPAVAEPLLAETGFLLTFACALAALAVLGPRWSVIVFVIVLLLPRARIPDRIARARTVRRRRS
jgi:hypothetical protein